MAYFSDLSDLINKRTGGNSGTPEDVHFFIDSRAGGAAATALVAGKLTSLWQYQKMPGGEGAAPTTAAVPTNSTAGGLFQTNPGGGRDKWLLGLTALSTQTLGVILADRLSHQGGLDGTSTSAQTTNLPTATLTRYTGAASVGNMIGLEIYSQVGTTARTVTVSYTNQAGTASRTTKATDFGGANNREAQRFIICPLQDGDTGVQSVESVTLSASTGTAGNFGVVIFRPLIPWTPLTTNQAAAMDFISGVPAVKNVLSNACVWPIIQATTSTVQQIFGTLTFAES